MLASGRVAGSPSHLQHRADMEILKAVIRALASLRLTVALLSLSMVLIFIGTLAQVRVGVWEAVDTYFRSAVAWVDLQLLIPESWVRVPWRVPLPGGAVIGVALLANLLAAHAGRFKLTGRRAGVMALHAGLIVLIAGEFVTALFADEGLMSIDVGRTVNYAEDLRTTEIAVTGPAGVIAAGAVVIPAARAERASATGDRISEPGLPFELEVLEWVPNARLLRGSAAGAADRGVGLEAFADRLPVVRGVDGAQTDAPAAYVRLHRDGTSLGTWLLWANLIEPQSVDVEGKAYGLALRYRRTYKPYELTLLEFRHDTFVGTQIARNFSSRVRLVDRERGVDREVLIWMNNPLRYRGATFYQASYKPDGSGTVLQVVRNPGAALPYIAGSMVGLGMLVHMLVGLTGFLRRRNAGGTRPSAVDARGGAGPASGACAPDGGGGGSRPWLTLSAVMIGLVMACSALLRSPATSEYDLRTFAALPVTSGGRVKPMDSAARHVLMVAGGRQSVVDGGSRMEAVEFLLGLMGRPEDVADLPTVRIDHPDVLAILGLTPEMGGRKRISLNRVEAQWHEVVAQAHRALDVEPKGRDAFQRAVVGLYGGVETVLAHARMREPYMIPPLREGETWRSFHEAFMSSGLAFPPGHPAVGERLERDVPHPAVASVIEMMTAYSRSDAEEFNRAVRAYDGLLRDVMPGTMRRMNIEVLFNRARLFAGTAGVYVLAFVLLGLWLLLRLRTGSADADRGNDRRSALRVSAVTLLWTALAVHTIAIVARIYLQGRPPVTNLYSSAVFVGWASVLFGLILERLHPVGIAALGAATVGFGTLVVAHNLGTDGDTMQMMQAVLDSNFWLSTHVVTITLGYSATFLAGALGLAYVLLGVFTRVLTEERAKAMGRMVYGMVCFALLLSFVGTVLGGIWADQSWGRFWGWDPKENGAALVVLLNAIILHARWSGLVRRRGIMLLAIGGNVVTAWSWFGTNMLGVGLHSYGFMDSAVAWLLVFVAAQLLVIGLGLTPQRSWRSPGA